MDNLYVKISWHVLSYIDGVLTVAFCIDGKLADIMADSSGRLLERLDNL